MVSTCNLLITSGSLGKVKYGKGSFLHFFTLILTSTALNLNVNCILIYDIRATTIEKSVLDVIFSNGLYSHHFQELPL